MAGNERKKSAMKKLVAITMLCASTLAVALTVCGCGDGEVDSLAVRQSEYSPMVRDSAKFALGVNLDKEQAFKIVDSYAARMIPLLKESPEDAQNIQEQVALYKQDIFRDASEEVRKFMEDSGLREADFRWAVASIDGDAGKVFCAKPQLGGVSFAIAVEADVKRIIAAIKKGEAEAGKKIDTFEEVEIEGASTWHVIPKETRDARDFAKFNVDPYIASLDGRLMLLALSRETMAKQIRLYRNGEGKGDSLGGFAAAADDFLHLRLAGIGDAIRKNAKDKDLDGISKFMQNGAEIVKGLKNIDIDVTTTVDGAPRQSISLEVASAEDAEQIRTCLLGLLTMVKLGLSRNPDAPKEARRYFNAVKIENTANKVEVKNTDALMIMAAALFPAISSATTTAKTSALAMKGRNLFVAIIKANVDRESAGLAPVWPRTHAEDGASTNDISGRIYKSSVEYFADLFDVAAYGTPEWAPYVDVDVAMLGKDAVARKTVNLDGLEWCIAANVTDYMPDCIPVLVSANFNPEFLLRKWDGITDGAKPLPVGPESGAAKSMFGDNAVVMILKGGAARTIKKKDLSYNTIYSCQKFDATSMPHPLVYLMPNGLAEPTGGKQQPRSTPLGTHSRK